MTTGPGEYGRRLSRVENDVTAMYEMIGDIQTVQSRHSAEFARIRTKLLEHDARFDAIDARFDGIDGEIVGLKARFDAVDARLDAIDARFGTVDTALAEILRRLPEAS